jgi:uncharacterized protein YwqG
MKRPETLRQYRILFERVPDGEQSIDPNKLGQRSKLGGTPNWDQSNETPTCSSCDKEMTFIAQLDSIEHQSKSNPHSMNALSKDKHYMFGDVGMLYVFFCFECLETQTVFQCG